jgi:hypothetical protein
MQLKQTYGFINPTQLAENYNKMTAPINFQDPIEAIKKKMWMVFATPTQACNPTWKHNMSTFPSYSF